MKNLIIISAILMLFTFSAYAQDENVPQKVKDAFAKKFPKAKKVEWDKENQKQWEAEFKMDKKEYSANFDADGTWKETEYEIKKSELPIAVKNTLEKEFSKYKLEEVEVSQKAEGIVYEFEFEKGEKSIAAVILPNGKVKEIVTQENDEHDDDDDDEHDDDEHDDDEHE